MKDELNKKHIATAVYIALLVIASVAVIFLMLGARDFFINKQYTGVFKILAPFIYGFVLAYLLNPLLIFFNNKVFSKCVKSKDENRGRKLRHALSLISTYIVAALLITMLMLMVIPQVGTSINQLAAIAADLFNPYESESGEKIDGNANAEISSDSNMSLPSLVLDGDIEFNKDDEYVIDIDAASLSNSKIGVYIRDLAASVQHYIDDLGIQLDIEETFNNFFIGFTANIVDLTATYIAPVFNKTASLVLSTASWIFNIFLGVIISIYVLSGKDKLIAQIKKFLFALFPERFVHKSIDITRKSHEIFGGFITGEFLDALIVGIVCFAFMSIFNMKYAMLISIIIGVTNIIPFFGPFIGAVPSIFFLLINDFWQAIWFMIFILIFQQIDGNIIKPKILGSTIGLSSFWIIFAILIMNGLFGIFGMFVGVPLFAIIYTLTKEYAENKLRRKGLPVETEEYIYTKENGIETREKRAEPHETIFSKIEAFSKRTLKHIHNIYRNSDAHDTEDTSDEDDGKKK